MILLVARFAEPLSDSLLVKKYSSDEDDVIKEPVVLCVVQKNIYQLYLLGHRWTSDGPR